MQIYQEPLNTSQKASKINTKNYRILMRVRMEASPSDSCVVLGNSAIVARD